METVLEMLLFVFIGLNAAMVLINVHRERYVMSMIQGAAIGYMVWVAAL